MGTKGVSPRALNAQQGLYFRNNRELLKRLCQIANECLLEYLRQVTGKPDGQLGMIMTIHTFGEYMGYNCHLHALLARHTRT